MFLRLPYYLVPPLNDPAGQPFYHRELNPFRHLLIFGRSPVQSRRQIPLSTLFSSFVRAFVSITSSNIPNCHTLPTLTYECRQIRDHVLPFKQHNLTIALYSLTYFMNRIYTTIIAFMLLSGTTLAQENTPYQTPAPELASLVTAAPTPSVSVDGKG